MWSWRWWATESVDLAAGDRWQNTDTDADAGARKYDYFHGCIHKVAGGFTALSCEVRPRGSDDLNWVLLHIRLQLIRLALIRTGQIHSMKPVRLVTDHLMRASTRVLYVSSLNSLRAHIAALMISTLHYQSSFDRWHSPLAGLYNQK